jgi:hypothetical protein
MKILDFFRIRKKRVRSTRPQFKGEFHNLQEIYSQVNEQYFEGKLNLPIGWTGSKRSKPRTRVLFGSYNPQTCCIKIHRRLDQPDVPVHFIAFIIYHEMLHHVLPPILVNNRRKIHHAAFKQMERRFVEFAFVTEYREKMRETWFKPAATKRIQLRFRR